MKKIGFIIFLLFIILGGYFLLSQYGINLSFKEKSDTKNKLENNVSLQQEWFPFAGFAGEVSGSKRFASSNGIKLDVLAGSEQVDPIKIVLSGGASFGVVGGDLLIAAVAKGAPLVAIGTINCHSPTVFIVGEKSDIYEPKNFVGKKIGILAGTNTERIYQLMVKRTGVNPQNIKEVQIPFDLQTYLLNQYDVRPAFIYDEPVSLEQKGFKYRLIKPEDFGVQFTGTVYFTTKEKLIKDRKTVIKSLKTLIQGWKFAVANPTESVKDLIGVYPSLDTKRETRALELGIPYFSGSPQSPLQCDSKVWQQMISDLEEINVIPKKSVSIENVWDPSALEEAYKELNIK